MVEEGGGGKVETEEWQGERHAECVLQYAKARAEGGSEIVAGCAVYELGRQQSEQL